MHLTGMILFFGSLIVLILWSRYAYYHLYKYKILANLSEEQKMMEYMKGAVIYVALAISAGMAWG